MDIPQVLAALRPTDDWGPGANTSSTYAELVAGWRGANPCPSEEEMAATWADIEANRATAEAARRRQEAITTLLTSNEPRDVALRMLIRDLYTQVNDLRELHGLPRQLESTIVPRVVAGISEGFGEV